MNRTHFTLLLSFLTFSAIPLQADDWPQWLGPKGDAVWRETGILKTFPKAGPQVVWRQKIHSGYTGPSVSQGKVLVMDYVLDSGENHYEGTQRDKLTGKERVLCLSEKTGEILWKHEYDCAYNISYAAGPRSTPTIEENRVYIVGAMGDFKCLNLETGKVIWEIDFKKEYYSRPAHWGACTHPLIYKDFVICIVSKDAHVVAFNKMTGKEIWRNVTTRDIGYSSPVLINAGGVEQLIAWSGEELNSLNPNTGELYWAQPLKTIYGLGVMTPRFHNNRLFAGGTPRVSAMFQLDTKKPTASVLWEGSGRRGISPSQSIPLMEGDHFYGVDGNGKFHCLEIETGKRLWGTFDATTGDRPLKGAGAFIIKQADRFFLFNTKGDLIIANLSPEGYEEIDRAHLLKPSPSTSGTKMVWCHPAFANKNMYVRNHKEIIRVSLSSEN